MSTERKVTKREQAEKVYARMMKRKNTPTPADVKAEFVNKIGMTTAMAATYYHLIKNGAWKK